MSDCRYNLRGEIDLATAPSFRADFELLLAASSADVVVDCAGLTFIDSSGIAVLLEARDALAAQGRRFSLEHVSSTPLRSLQLLGLTDLLLRDEMTADL